LKEGQDDLWTLRKFEGRKMIGEQISNRPLIGAAGVHFVVSELSIRGHIALPTIRNTAGIDVVVVKSDGSSRANLQVKSSKSKVSFWPISENYEKLSGKDVYYVFVRYLKREKRFEAFLEPTDKVVIQARKNEEEERKRGCKKWAPVWFLPKDEKNLNRVKQQWLDF
jgi:hypothetical protein